METHVETCSLGGTERATGPSAPPPRPCHRGGGQGRGQRAARGAEGAGEGGQGRQQGTTATGLGRAAHRSLTLRRPKSAPRWSSLRRARRAAGGTACRAKRRALSSSRGAPRLAARSSSSATASAILAAPPRGPPQPQPPPLATARAVAKGFSRVRHRRRKQNGGRHPPRGHWAAALGALLGDGPAPAVGGSVLPGGRAGTPPRGAEEESRHPPGGTGGNVRGVDGSPQPRWWEWCSSGVRSG